MGKFPIVHTTELEECQKNLQHMDLHGNEVQHAACPTVKCKKPEEKPHIRHIHHLCSVKRGVNLS